MPRQTSSVTTSGRNIESRPNRKLTFKSKSPYADHPLFNLRRFTLIISVLGLLCALASVGPYSDPTDWLCGPAAFLLSILLVQWDFADWRTDDEPELDCVFDDRGEAAGWVWEWRRGWMGRLCRVRILRGGARNQDGANERTRRGHGRHAVSRSERSPLLGNHGSDDFRRSSAGRQRSSQEGGEHRQWPRTAIVSCDFAITLFFLYVCIMNIQNSTVGYYYSPTRLMQAYCSLLAAFAAALHGKCWWEELLARHKQEWERERDENEAEDEDEEDRSNIGRGAARDRSVRDLESGIYPAYAQHDAVDDEPVERQLLKRVLTFLRKNGSKDDTDKSDDGDHASADETEREDQHTYSRIHILTPETSNSDTVVPIPHSSQDSAIVVESASLIDDGPSAVVAEADGSSTHDFEAVMIKKKKKARSKMNSNKGKQNEM